MRAGLICLIWACLAAPAAAQGCGDLRPRFPFERQVETRDYLRCLGGEIARLEREQARMAAALQAQARALAAIPADYANTDGRVAAVPDRPVRRAVFVLTARRGGPAASLACTAPGS